MIRLSEILFLPSEGTCLAGQNALIKRAYLLKFVYCHAHCHNLIKCAHSYLPNSAIHHYRDISS